MSYLNKKMVNALSGMFFCGLHAILFILAIKHRHDISGIVWALLWVGEQIHMKPPALFPEVVE